MDKKKNEKHEKDLKDLLPPADSQHGYSDATESGLNPDHRDTNIEIN
jgi:hypothetical protein